MFSMNHSTIIRTHKLSYHYSKKVQTLFDIDLKVPGGSIYGFLGPNGSGKTTTLSLLLGLLKNQQGKIERFGEPIHKNRLSSLRRIGALVENPSVYAHLSAKENIEIYRKAYGVAKSRVAKVLDIVGLSAAGSKPARKFSLGMKQRLAIGLALLPNPELLILDEPANGLDPAGIIELRELITDLNRNYGMTVLISSHLLSEVEKIVNHIGIIVRGKLIFQGALTDLYTLRQRASRVFIKTSDNDRAMEVLENFHPEKSGENLSVPFKNSETVAEICRRLTSHPLDVYLLYPKKTDLEQLFIDLTIPS